MKYLYWKEEKISTSTGQLPSEKIISKMYSQGFVFTRIDKGVMQQTRSIRIDLSQFELSSENRRILRKIKKGSEEMKGSVGSKNNYLLLSRALPLTPTDYHWSIAKLAKDFYDKKFGPGIMSAATIKTLLTNEIKSNFNTLLTFSNKDEISATIDKATGYAICYKNATIFHYSYPFYDLTDPVVSKDMGLGMMILTIEQAKKDGFDYIYLGSLQRPSDTYKLQFKGIEWFDGGPTGSNTWLTDIKKIKTILQ